VGNYRIVYAIERSSEHERIVVRAVRHRAIAYGPRRRRL
jgi:mRNA-degrading endonuclease RelE of RelBE toxin-antitoxin system